jgi:hypothetical protein
MSPDDPLLSASPKELAARLRAGHPIDPARLDDTAYRGVSLGLPSWVEALAWKTFRKTFHRDPQTGVLRGWNVRMEQTGLAGPDVPKTKRGAPIEFGHYVVEAAADHPVPAGLEHALLIHYGKGDNPALDPSRLLRDPLVALEPGRVDRLLGWTYVALGAPVPTPSYFLLEAPSPLLLTG